VVEGMKISYIKTGIGAPVLMDVILALGVTLCKQIIFIGSVGALDHKMGIGDIVIPAYSICGDGASRYLASEKLADGDVFGEKQYPDKTMYDCLKEATSHICEDNSVKWHIGNNFSTDTIFAQFVHIDEIIGMGCNIIEMETAAAFRAAAFTGIPMAALFSVSDNTVVNKSLVSGRTPEEMQYRKKVRSELFPQIIAELFHNSR
jgi:purine-nucleoside phosphorylase